MVESTQPGAGSGPTDGSFTVVHLDHLTSAHLTAAREAEHGRSTELVVHDGELRQSVIALAAGTELTEHNSPPAGSLQVLQGRIRLTAGESAQELAAGELLVLTHERHAVTALEDSAFLLTSVTSVDRGSYGGHTHDLAEEHGAR